jgi:hypothetical protein
MKISGPHLDPARKGAPKPWYLSYFAAVLDDAGHQVVVDGKPKRTRRRPYYATKASAQADKESLVEQFTAAGAGTFIHSRTAQLDYERARRALPDGVTVESAALFYLKHHPSGEVVSIEAARSRFLTAIERLRKKDHHYWDLRTRTSGLARAFAGRDPNTITRKEAMTWLLSLPQKPRGLLNYKRAACNFFNWMLAEDPPLIDSNPFGGIKRKQLPKILQKEVEFLPLDRVERYLRTAERYDPDLVAHECVQLFAGVRADDEMADFLGEWVKPATKEIVTPAEITKSGRRDVIDGLEENFWAWWTAYGREGLLRPRNYEQRWRRIRILADAEDGARRDEMGRLEVKVLLRRHKPSRWPWNARRRTFCSYKVAKDGSAGKAAQILRHKGGEAILRNSYLGTGIPQAKGAAFFNLLPKKVRHPIRPVFVARGIIRLQQDPAYVRRQTARTVSA